MSFIKCSGFSYLYLNNNFQSHLSSLTMGDFRVKKINSYEERNVFYKQVLRDIEVFDFMLNNNLISNDDNMIGAEQELALIDNYCAPHPESEAILKLLSDNHFTNELATFNLEINLDPLPLEGTCFSHMEEDLLKLLGSVDNAAKNTNGRVFLTGILPTIVREFLDYKYMSPEKRYKVLSDELRRLRKKDFSIYLQGVDDLQMDMKDILIESCNTSYQVHLQINASQFSRYHNWSQIIAGPVLASAVNSPLLFGKELWNETRIGIFKQSLDTRNFNSHYREKSPRVYFGRQWLEGDASEIWKKDVSMFPLIFRGIGENDPWTDLNNGIIPKLDSVRLHSGTTYTWNRLCYGVHDNKAHLRIECRYLPAGPSPSDEIANQLFWTGLMKAIPEEDKFWINEDLRAYKQNFLNAARFGLHSEMYWLGKYYPTRDLILEKLIPLAAKGLTDFNVNTEDIEKYLSIIRDRVSSYQTGADWSINNFRRLIKKFKPSLASRILVTESLRHQEQNIPVGQWPEITSESLHHYFGIYYKSLTVFDVMSAEIYSVNETMSIALAKNVMKFRQIHHLIVENDDHQFIGLINDKIVNSIADKENTLLKDVDLIGDCFVSTTMKLEEARNILNQNKLEALIIEENGRVVGILTLRDL